jgi:hypothetical protein
MPLYLNKNKKKLKVFKRLFRLDDIFVCFLLMIWIRIKY